MECRDIYGAYFLFVVKGLVDNVCGSRWDVIGVGVIPILLEVFGI